MNVKVIKIAKEKGKKITGNILCPCKKCQIAVGVKNIKKAHEKGGFDVPSDHRFAYYRANPSL